MDEGEIEALRSSVRETLKVILDPELGENIVDLGLIYGIDVSGNGDVRVRMTTTTKACPATKFLQEAVKLRVSELPGVTAAEVDLTFEPEWSPEMIKGGARVFFDR
jgi:metal-sulfur cluster biosynthetic enzyme